jgi:hypothetical protein
MTSTRHFVCCGALCGFVHSGFLWVEGDFDDFGRKFVFARKGRRFAKGDFL